MIKLRHQMLAWLFLLLLPVTALGQGVAIGNYDDDTFTSAARFWAPKKVSYVTSYINSFTRHSSGWAADCQYQASRYAGTADRGPASGVTVVMGFPWGSDSQGSQVSQVAAGSLDAQITGCVDAWKNNGYKEVIFRPAWEMNGKWSVWSVPANGAGNYVKAWHHFVQVARAQAELDDITLLIDWCPNVNQPNAKFADYWPGATYVDSNGKTQKYVDIVGIDAYDRPIGGSYPGTASSGPGDYQLGVAESYARQYGLVMAIDEMGITTPSYAKALINYLQNQRDQSVTMLYIAFWNVNSHGKFQFTNGAMPEVASILLAGLGPNGTVKNPPAGDAGALSPPRR